MRSCLCDLGHIFNLFKPQIPHLQNLLYHGLTVMITQDEATWHSVQHPNNGSTGSEPPVCNFKSEVLKTENVFITDVVATPKLTLFGGKI